MINPLNAELNPIYHLLALSGAHPVLHVSRIRVKIEVMQAYQNSGCQVAVAHKCCVSSVLELHHVTVVAYRILRQFLGFRKTWAPKQECVKSYWFIHAYAKQLQVAIISFVMCVHLHVSERLPLEGFLWKPVFAILTQCCRRSPNLEENQQTLH
jgi:hypothetical protein